jgi:hypothetical protein
VKRLESIRLALGVLAAALGALPVPAAAQWVAKGEQFYLPAAHNWAFRESYAPADRLFNAFDNAHNVLAEVLWTRPEAPVARLEEEEYDFIVNDLLVRPPRLPLVEEAIGPGYARLVPEAKMMFEWAHLLHRQIYDVYADERVTDKAAAVDELMRYYRSRPDLAFATTPKSMALMEEQPYSLAFRRAYPKFNGLIWAYHWLQVGLYEPLIGGGTEDERQAGVLAAVGRFFSMLKDAPGHMPSMMPMTSAVAPEFTRRHPDAAAVFDNLHAMHDIISDILVSPVVPREEKRMAILEALARYRDGERDVMTPDEWRAHGAHLAMMGGPATDILRPAPTGAAGPAVENGAEAVEHTPAGEPGRGVGREGDAPEAAPGEPAQEPPTTPPAHGPHPRGGPSS